MSDIKKLPVKNKREDSKTLFLTKKKAVCAHNGGFLLDRDAGQCICKDCSKVVDPMLALEKLANKESHYMRTRERYQDEMARLAKRSKTKCQRCGEITKISGR